MFEVGRLLTFPIYRVGAYSKWGRGWKNTAHLVKYPRVLYDKPSNKVDILHCSIQYVTVVPIFKLNAKDM